MGDKSKIEWTDATWNPIVGCSLVSPGCTNCYAMKWAHTGMKPVKHYAGTTYEDNGAWTGKINAAPEHIWLAPFGWKKPRRIFVNSMGDVFHEKVPDAWIDRLFAIMARCPQHTFQILTKRSKRMQEYLNEKWRPAPPQILQIGKETFELKGDTGPTGRRLRVEEACEPLLDKFKLADTNKPELWTENDSCKAMQWAWPLPNVWLGVSCEDQRRADERIPDLLATPAAVRFVSAEPLLGPIDFLPYLFIVTHEDDAILACPQGHDEPLPFHDPATTPLEDIASPRLDWIIAGGESGPGARPMHPDWVRGIRDQCAAAGTAFFFKQWGEHLPWDQFPTTQIDDDPEQTRFKTMEWEDGRWHDVGFPMWCDSTDGTIDDDNCVARVGKKRAGRLLDGIEHNGYPA